MGFSRLATKIHWHTFGLTYSMLHAFPKVSIHYSHIIMSISITHSHKHESPLDQFPQNRNQWQMEFLQYEYTKTMRTIDSSTYTLPINNNDRQHTRSHKTNIQSEYTKCQYCQNIYCSKHLRDQKLA